MLFQRWRNSPHDAGAYRRSRQTAVRLIMRICRYGLYLTLLGRSAQKPLLAKVNGQDMAKVRIAIGRRNQNRKANQELAYKIKRWLTRHIRVLSRIFSWAGSYNQEISPGHCCLNGHESNEAKINGLLADVIQKTMYGGNIKDRSEQTDESKEELAGKIQGLRLLAGYRWE